MLFRSPSPAAQHPWPILECGGLTPLYGVSHLSASRASQTPIQSSHQVTHSLQFRKPRNVSRFCSLHTLGTKHPGVGASVTIPDSALFGIPALNLMDSHCFVKTPCNSFRILLFQKAAPLTSLESHCFANARGIPCRVLFLFLKSRFTRQPGRIRNSATPPENRQTTLPRPARAASPARAPYSAPPSARSTTLPARRLVKIGEA